MRVLTVPQLFGKDKYNQIVRAAGAMALFCRATSVLLGLVAIIVGWWGIRNGQQLLPEEEMDHLLAQGPSKVGVIVTGASSGIGAQIAYTYAARGASLVIAARRHDKLLQVAEKCREMGATAVKVNKVDFSNFTDSDSKRFIEEAVTFFRQYGAGLDVLHLNHAVLTGSDWTTHGTEELSLLPKRMEINFVSLVRLTTFALPHLEDSMLGGRVVVSSSAAGRTGNHRLASYAASKHAIHGFFDSLRQDLWGAGSRVSVTVVVIGLIETEGMTEAMQGRYANVGRRSAQDAALAISLSGMRREWTAQFPAEQITGQWLFYLLFPAHHDAAVILNTHNHECTRVAEYLMLWSCWSEIQELMHRLPSKLPMTKDV